MSVSSILVRNREPRSEYIVVTPEMAESWLRSNTRNRPMKKSRVMDYAASMTAGLWRHPTGEPIIFDQNGILQDGQHRLLAQISAKATIKYLVVLDADPADFLVIDQGGTRLAADVLAIEGIPSSTHVAAAAKIVLHMRNSPNLVWSSTQRYVSRAMAIDEARAHAESYVRHERIGQSVNKACRIPRAAFSATGVYVESISESCDQWTEFSDRLISGAMLPETSPIACLRQWGITRRIHNTRETQRAVVFIGKAWNAFIERRELKRFKWLDSEMPMPLPMPAHY